VKQVFARGFVVAGMGFGRLVEDWGMTGVRKSTPPTGCLIVGVSRLGAAGKVFASFFQKDVLAFFPHDQGMDCAMGALDPVGLGRHCFD
jgi:hypothetical protein